MKKKQEENKKDDLYFELKMGDNISLNDIKIGRIPIPNDDPSAIFTIYEPDISETVKMAYEGLINVWKKQGKNPIKELKKMI